MKIILLPKRFFFSAFISSFFWFLFLSFFLFPLTAMKEEEKKNIELQTLEEEQNAPYQFECLVEVPLEDDPAVNRNASLAPLPLFSDDDPQVPIEKIEGACMSCGLPCYGAKWKKERDAMVMEGPLVLSRMYSFSNQEENYSPKSILSFLRGIVKSLQYEYLQSKCLLASPKPLPYLIASNHHKLLTRLDQSREPLLLLLRFFYTFPPPENSPLYTMFTRFEPAFLGQESITIPTTDGPCEFQITNAQKEEMKTKMHQIYLRDLATSDQKITARTLNVKEQALLVENNQYALWMTLNNLALWIKPFPFSSPSSLSVQHYLYFFYKTTFVLYFAKKIFIPLLNGKCKEIDCYGLSTLLAYGINTAITQKSANPLYQASIVLALITNTLCNSACLKASVALSKITCPNVKKRKRLLKRIQLLSLLTGKIEKLQAERMAIAESYPNLPKEIIDTIVSYYSDTINAWKECSPEVTTLIGKKSQAPKRKFTEIEINTHQKCRFLPITLLIVQMISFLVYLCKIVFLLKK